MNKLFVQKFCNIIVFNLVMITLLSGCSNNNEQTIALDKLQNTAGDYQFQNLPWGSTSEQCEEILKLSFDQQTATAAANHIIYEISGFTLNDIAATTSFEFKDDGLVMIDFIFQPNASEQEAFFEDIKKKLFAEYGEVIAQTPSSASEELSITTETENYLWESQGTNHTTLLLRRVYINGTFQYISLSVSNVTLAKPAQ